MDELLDWHHLSGENTTNFDPVSFISFASKAEIHVLYSILLFTTIVWCVQILKFCKILFPTIFQVDIEPVTLPNSELILIKSDPAYI